MSESREVVQNVVEGANAIQRRYAHGHDRPLGSYGAIIAVFVASLAAVGSLIRRRGQLPERVSGADLALVTVATARLSRTLAKDPIASPLRAPFTRYEGVQGPGELHEEVRGDGLQHAVGELVTCPFCTAEWVAGAFVAGLALAPRATRLVASMLVAKAGSDVLQFAYARLEDA